MTLRKTFHTGLALLALATAPVFAQSYNSTSDGSDGALNITTNTTFDPTQYTGTGVAKNIFNFTTINIASGATLRLSGRNINGPVYFLATGAVTISVTIDLSGENGSAGSINMATRTVAFPGAGGYAGGLGGRTYNLAPAAATAGQGPAGGAAGSSSNSYRGQPGGFNANFFLVPLIGGSGGGGGLGTSQTLGDGGGAGGGAILIASSASITCSGTIDASGGNGGHNYPSFSGAGAGGAIHLIAPTVAGSCTTYGNGGSNYIGRSGADGYVRIETQNYTGGYNAGSITATPNLYLPTAAVGTIKALSVNGVTLPATPTGSWVTPDATVNTSNSVNVVIKATNIPVGTVVTLQVTSDQASDTTMTCPGLTGTLAQSTTTCQAVFPSGLSLGYITASW